LSARRLAGYGRLVGTETGDGLIVEVLGHETLVYDTARHEAHALSGRAAAEFAAASDDVSRREVLRKLALVGAAATAGPFIRSIVAPTPAQAQTGLADNQNCATSGQCANACCCALTGFLNTCQTIAACNGVNGACVGSGLANGQNCAHNGDCASACCCAISGFLNTCAAAATCAGNNGTCAP
jgi:hypothetical protein